MKKNVEKAKQSKIINKEKVAKKGTAVNKISIENFNSSYLDSVREKIITDVPLGEDQSGGFRDQYGYLVGMTKCNGERYTDIGEGVLFVCSAIIAIATSNYEPDQWDNQHTNKEILRLFETLNQNSKGNVDSFGRFHYIRHPDDLDYDKDGNVIRNVPLSKDSYGAMLAACYYAYHCPNSSNAVKNVAKNFMSELLKYLTLFQWKIYCEYPQSFNGEFESITRDGSQVNANIYESNGVHRPYVGIESFLLWPHEIYALKSVASSMGLVTNDIRPWDSSLRAEIAMTAIDLAMPYVAEYFGLLLYKILDAIKIEFPFSHVFPGVIGEYLDQIKLEISDADKNNIVGEFKRFIVRECVELVRGAVLFNVQPFEIWDLAINAILNFLPDRLAGFEWKELLAKAFEVNTRYLEGDGFKELISYFVALVGMKLQDLDSAVVNYSVWTFVVASEHDPVLSTILRPIINLFWGEIRSSNPSTLWAWLRDDQGVIDSHLMIIESKDQFYWNDYAFSSTPLNTWFTEGNKTVDCNMRSGMDYNGYFPRIDYLIVYGLKKKGSPEIVQLDLILLHWWDLLVGFLRVVAETIISTIQGIFESTGQFIRRTVDALGRIIEEIWNSVGTYIRRILDASGRILHSETIHNDGTREETTYEEDGTESSYERWKPRNGDLVLVEVRLGNVFLPLESQIISDPGIKPQNYLTARKKEFTDEELIENLIEEWETLFDGNIRKHHRYRYIMHNGAKFLKSHFVFSGKFEIEELGNKDIISYKIRENNTEQMEIFKFISGEERLDYYSKNSGNQFKIEPAKDFQFFKWERNSNNQSLSYTFGKQDLRTSSIDIYSFGEFNQSKIEIRSKQLAKLKIDNQSCTNLFHNRFGSDSAIEFLYNKKTLSLEKVTEWSYWDRDHEKRILLSYRNMEESGKIRILKYDSKFGMKQHVTFRNSEAFIGSTQKEDVEFHLVKNFQKHELVQTRYFDTFQFQDSGRWIFSYSDVSKMIERRKYGKNLQFEIWRWDLNGSLIVYKKYKKYKINLANSVVGVDIMSEVKKINNDTYRLTEYTGGRGVVEFGIQNNRIVNLRNIGGTLDSFPNDVILNSKYEHEADFYPS